jgi:hypothetical protein
MRDGVVLLWFLLTAAAILFVVTDIRSTPESAAPLSPPAGDAPPLALGLTVAHRRPVSSLSRSERLFGYCFLICVSWYSRCRHLPSFLNQISLTNTRGGKVVPW